MQKICQIALALNSNYLSIFRFTFQQFVTKRQTSRLNFPHKNFSFNTQEVISMVKKSTRIYIMKYDLPPFSLIRDFGTQNNRGNVSKISVSHTCY